MNATNKMNKTSTLARMLGVVGLALVVGGCASNTHRPQIAEASENGVFYLDLRRSLESAGESAREKKITEELLEKNCKLGQNLNHPVCNDPNAFILYSGQVRNGMWGKGPVFYGVYIPKSLNVRSFSPPSEKDGDIVRAKVIPGPVSMLAYDGVIERYDDQNRACWWEGTHNYTGGVVCPSYNYSYKNLDVDKL